MHSAVFCVSLPNYFSMYHMFLILFIQRGPPNEDNAVESPEDQPPADFITITLTPSDPDVPMEVFSVVLDFCAKPGKGNFQCDSQYLPLCYKYKQHAYIYEIIDMLLNEDTVLINSNFTMN